MSYWICCNYCFLYPGADRRLAVTSCGHLICSVCYPKGTKDECLICNTRCQVSALSEKSSSDVKALFSDINVVASKHFTEIKKVMMFQARHQNRLLTYYQQRNKKLEEVLVNMKHKMQQMAKTLGEQSAYIAKLESGLQHQSVRTSSGSQRGQSSLPGHNSVLQIPFNSPMCLSRHSSSTNVNAGNSTDDERFRKPNTAPRLTLVSPTRERPRGPTPHGQSSHRMMANDSVHSATISNFHRAPTTPDVSRSQSSAWMSPIFKPPTSFRHSMSSLVGPRP